MARRFWWTGPGAAAGVVLWTLVVVPQLQAQASAADTYSLRRAIQIALANSRTLEDAEQGLEVAGQQVREAWASVLPDISANMSYSRNLKVQEIFLPEFFFDPTAPPDAVRPVRVGSDNNWQAGLSVSQPLFEYGVFIGVGAASRFRALQGERVRGTAQQVVSAVRQAYFDALLALESQRLTEQSIARVRQTLDETRAMNRVGLASDYDVLRLEVQYSNIQANLRRSQNAVAAAKRSLLVEMGLDPGRPIDLEGRLNEIDLEVPERNDPVNAELLYLAGVEEVAAPYDELLQTALRRRTDLRQLRSTILLEEARLAVEKAEFYPRISVFSNYNIMAQENGAPSFFGESPNQRTSTAAAGVRIELPIFSGFSRFARVRQARWTVRQNETRLERAEQDAANQVRTLLDAVQEARQRAASQRRAVDQAGRGFEIASAQYREGVGSQLQITDAEVALRESEFNYAQAVYDYLTARAQLEMAIGMVPDAAGGFPTQGGM
ncbi:MAG: TolC family protein [Gemmatimonadales bacterium]|nr:TolC family protein [Gemmatimonadales bacterium]NIN13343.1 TolC family protein [Gemmatimonadales bacterium]NIN51346.1 TolC family protein [Gemmatimonadales bacterium]NIP08810.1 TolC family protein [Gemmatimonadales bacterium]NIQ99804.1 TolC family protein [Gemmatimonadales bacterium]